MKLSMLFTIAAVYMGILGLMYALAPAMLALDALPANASAELLSFLRIPAGAFLGIATLNWLTRNAAKSAALNAIMMGNTVGFGVTTLVNIVALMNGRQIALVFGAVHLLFTLGFIMVGRKNMYNAK